MTRMEREKEEMQWRLFFFPPLSPVLVAVITAASENSILQDTSFQWVPITFFFPLRLSN